MHFTHIGLIVAREIGDLTDQYTAGRNAINFKERGTCSSSHCAYKSILTPLMLLPLKIVRKYYVYYQKYCRCHCVPPTRW